MSVAVVSVAVVSVAVVSVAVVSVAIVSADVVSMRPRVDGARQPTVAAMLYCG